MPLKSYLFLMTFATIICGLGLSLVLLTVNPLATNWLGFVLFYISLFLTIMGLASVVGFVFRFIFLRHRFVLRAVAVSFRQAFLFAVLVVVVLFLLSRGLFSWLNVLFLIVGFSALEFLLISLSINHE